jgi:hypothetical protein
MFVSNHARGPDMFTLKAVVMFDLRLRFDDMLPFSKKNIFRELWVPRYEREQAGGPAAERLRVCADLRGQGRRLDARRRRPVAVSTFLHAYPFCSETT